MKVQLATRKESIVKRKIRGYQQHPQRGQSKYACTSWTVT